MTQTSPLQKSEQHTLDLENEGRLTLPGKVLQRVNLKQSHAFVMSSCCDRLYTD